MSSTVSVTVTSLSVVICPCVALCPWTTPAQSWALLPALASSSPSNAGIFLLFLLPRLPKHPLLTLRLSQLHYNQSPFLTPSLWPIGTVCTFQVKLYVNLSAKQEGRVESTVLGVCSQGLEERESWKKMKRGSWEDRKIKTKQNKQQQKQLRSGCLCSSSLPQNRLVFESIHPRKPMFGKCSG